MKYLIVIVAILLPTLFNGQKAPAPEQTYSILLLGGTAHLGDGTKIEDAAIGFDQGKITYVGSMDNVDQSKWNKVIDTKGKHIYPGFIAPNSTLGLQEIGAVRATRDQREIGNIKPNVRSIIAYNSESDITTTVRSNGVLLGQITPRGGLISGTSSVVQFDAWNWEDAIVREDDGIHINWPKVYSKKNEKGKSNTTQEKNHQTKKAELYHFFEEAYAYYLGTQTQEETKPEKEQEEDSDKKKIDFLNKNKTSESIQSTWEKNLKYEAILDVWNGKKSVYIHADDVKKITEAVNFKKHFKIEHVTIVGGYDSWMVAELLNDNNVSVILQRIASLPEYDEDDYDLPFKLPSLLNEAGVLFCFDNSGDMEQMQTRNLPFFAGISVGFGLDYEKAVQSLTLNTAKILGIDNEIGSLELGKNATLFVSEGDALDMRTNNVTFAVIDGRRLVLDNRQKELYYKFKAKYR